jgi:GNAT superfamily N-acetyltransferase
LLREIAASLPRRFYAHLSPGLASALADRFDGAPHGTHHKMVLEEPSERSASPQESEVVLGPGDLAEVEAFYAAAYEGNWFDPRMLETRRYVGVRVEGQLAAVAGVHVYSPRYRVAALGNIATHPRHRKKGLGEAVTRALCDRLSRDTDLIGLNVHAENRTAIDLYGRIGFRTCASYEEIDFTRRGA